ncbi:MAG: aldo/keto reductase [Desulfosarcinaceae bacterium]|jgi:aryl-alcohol dehydrogenase-like predicted oxidoreductase
MKKRELGAGGFRIGEVGLGCWQFGGDFGPMAAQTAQTILETAVENGIDFFDTADVYGDGRSERLIGQFLAACHQPITVATKFGRGANVYPDAYTPEALRASASASIERLGVEAIDLLQLHCIPKAVLRRGEIFDWLREIKAEGMIRHFGASVESVEEALICLEQEGLLSLQVIFNIFRQKLITELFPRAQKRGVGIIVRLPLASGLLSGKFDRQTRFAETDHRHFNRDGQQFNVGETFAGLPFEKGVELADALKADLPEGMTMAQMALRWILDHEAVSVIIPGASSPAQAAANAAASGMAPLADQTHAKFSDFYKREVSPHIRGPY